MMRTSSHLSREPHSSTSRAVCPHPPARARDQRQAPDVAPPAAPSLVAHDFTHLPVHPPVANVIQRTATVPQHADEYERQADRVAEHVTRMPDAGPIGTCGCGGKCGACQKKHAVPARDPMGVEDVVVHDPGSTRAPATTLEALKSPGRPLDAATRDFMEARFGLDFSSVRIHSGALAAQAARDVEAHAYTLGHHVVFGTGTFAPATFEGRRLIAHELAHVVQQTAAGGVLAPQRSPKDKETKEAKPDSTASQDVAVVLGEDEGMFTEARVLAPGATILRPTTLDDLVKQLKTIKGPVKTLYFVAHMTEDGDLMFTSPGKMDYKPAEMIAARVKGILQVDSINFQGCNIAQSPGEMQKIAGALNATKATGSTCTLVEQTSDPVKVDGKPILRPEQLNDKKVKTAFDAGFKNLHALFVDKRKKCILNDSVDGYFQGGGKLIAYWANPGSMADDKGWDDTKSTCYKDLKVEKLDPTKKLPVIDPDDCKLIEVGAKRTP
jgi:hypothetical protein